MKEKLKTLLLLFLIVISISMTEKIWMHSPRKVIQITEKEPTSQGDKESYPLINMLSADKYLLNFSTQEHTLLYDDVNYGIWTMASSPLSELFQDKNVKIREVSGKEFSKYGNKESVLFYFSERINTYILARALDVHKPNEIVDAIPKIDRIYIYLGNRDPFFVFSNRTKHLRVDLEDIDLSNLRNQIRQIEKEDNYIRYYSMRETYGTEKDIFIHYEVDYNMPDVYVSNMVLDMDKDKKDSLAETFLNTNIDYINEVVEENNSSIYLYDKEVLKINTNGIIEYFRPLEEDVLERNLYQSLLTVSNFLSTRAKLEKDMYLSRVEEIEYDGNLGYKLNFKYKIRGIPVIMGNQDVGEYLEVEVFNNYIRSYKHYNRKDKIKFSDSLQENEDGIISAFEAIDRNYNLLGKWYLESRDMDKEDIENADLANKILDSIEDITLSYYDPCIKDTEEKLVAIWAITFENRLLAFDAYTGNLVYQKVL